MEHLTLNTGHSCDVPRTFVKQETMEVLLPIVRQGSGSLVNSVTKSNFRVIVTNHGGMGTISIQQSGGMPVVLCTVCSAKERDGEAWHRTLESYDDVRKAWSRLPSWMLDTMLPPPPTGHSTTFPWLVTLLTPAFHDLSTNDQGFLGCIEGCLGWACLERQSENPPPKKSTPTAKNANRSPANKAKHVWVEGSVLNDLFFAINHYFSTGDYIGMGMAFDLGDDLLIPLMHNPANPTDVEDWRKFRQRMSELTIPHTLDREDPSEMVDVMASQEFRDWFAEFQAEVNIASSIPIPLKRPRIAFEPWSLRIKKINVYPLTCELLESSGTAGWGSDYGAIQRAFPGKRKAILRR